MLALATVTLKPESECQIAMLCHAARKKARMGSEPSAAGQISHADCNTAPWVI